MAKAGFPAWRYDPKTGEGWIFDKPEDVPKGFVDHPNKCKVAPKVFGSGASNGSEEAGASPSLKWPGSPALDPAKDESPNKGLAKAEGLTKKAMMAEMDEAGIEYDKDLSADDMARFFLDLPAEEDEDEE